jgi:hypothetical protein
MSVEVGGTFLHKGFKVTKLTAATDATYQVTTPNGKVLPAVLKGQDALRGFVFDYRNCEAKDRCEEQGCGMPSKGPLMTRADGYHRVCHECAKVKWPQYWAFFKAHGWYPGTKWELDHNQLDQQSAEKLWDGSPRPRWTPKVAA